jgi:ABC-type transport system substrate-binding protein
MLSACSLDRSAPWRRIPAPAATTAAAAGSEDGGAAPETEAPGADLPAGTTLSDKKIEVGYNTSIDSLNCFRSNTGRNAPYLMNLFESLAVLSPESREMEPWAAKSWSTEDGGYTYTIEIWTARATISPRTTLCGISILQNRKP